MSVSDGLTTRRSYKRSARSNKFHRRHPWILARSAARTPSPGRCPAVPRLVRTKRDSAFASPIRLRPGLRRTNIDCVRLLYCEQRDERAALHSITRPRPGVLTSHTHHSLSLPIPSACVWQIRNCSVKEPISNRCLTVPITPQSASLPCFSAAARLAIRSA